MDKKINLLTLDELWQCTAKLPSDYAPIYDDTGTLRGHIKMRGLTGDELIEYQQSLTITTRDGKSKSNMKRAMSKLIVRCAINEDGSPYFKDSDILKVDQMAARTLMPWFELAQSLSGLTDDDLRDMVEDFTPTQNGHSPSDSH